MATLWANRIGGRINWLDRVAVSMGINVHGNITPRIKGDGSIEALERVIYSRALSVCHIRLGSTIMIVLVVVIMHVPIMRPNKCHHNGLFSPPTTTTIIMTTVLMTITRTHSGWATFNDSGQEECSRSF